MFEEFWNGILELTAKFVIPDWGSVIAMLPVLILVLIVLVLVVLFWKLLTMPKPRRGKGRLPAVAPPGVHMPGPSWAPFLAAIGAFLLFLGLVFGGPILVIGAIGLALTLLYWLVEALRLYDHDLGATAPALPTVVHDGPPEGVHMPGPSYLPLLAAIGMGMLMLGLVFGEWLLGAGIIALILSLGGWMRDARREYVKTEEADRTGHLESLPPPRTPRLLLSTLGLMLAVAFVIQIGWIPPRAAGGEAPGPSAVPGESGDPADPGASGGAGEPGDEKPVVHAKDVDFIEKTFSAPADVPFELEFVNEDEGIPHNVELLETGGASVFKGDIFPGVETQVYEVPALVAGTYQYICSVHPAMIGTATIQ